MPIWSRSSGGTDEDPSDALRRRKYETRLADMLVLAKRLYDDFLFMLAGHEDRHLEDYMTPQAARELRGSFAAFWEGDYRRKSKTHTRVDYETFIPGDDAAAVPTMKIVVVDETTKVGVDQSTAPAPSGSPRSPAWEIRISFNAEVTQIRDLAVRRKESPRSDATERI